MCPRPGRLLFSIMFLSSPLWGQAPPSTAPTVVNRQTNFADEIRKTVGFLQVRYKDGNETKIITGTCFFVSYPEPRLGPDLWFTYLVTNKHMAIPGVEKGAAYPVQVASLYLNTNPLAGQESAMVPLPVGNPVAWEFLDDDSVDLAVLPIGPSHDIFDYRAIPISLIATKKSIEEQGISAGNAVVFAGYFYQWPGNHKIQPIVRQGVLAMMPDEKINTTLQKPGRLYLADAHAFHGNSGSPLFVRVGGIRGNAILGEGYLLLGIVSGYYPEGESFSVPAATVLTGEVHDNSGIATVVPAEELNALLDSPRLKAQRDAEVEKQKKNESHSSTADEKVKAKP